MNNYVKHFLRILVAALASSVIGGLFGAVIALLSPEFVGGLFSPVSGSVPRYAAAVGAVWGLFIGAGAMAFVIGVSTVAGWFAPKTKTDGQ